MSRLIGLTGFALWYTPTGFIPAQDQGYFLDRHPAAARLVHGTHRRGHEEGRRSRPADPGVKDTVMLSGFDGPSKPRAASRPPPPAVLDDFKDRSGRGPDDRRAHRRGHQAHRRHRTKRRLLVVQPPTHPRASARAAASSMMVQDRQGVATRRSSRPPAAMIGQANQTPGLAHVYTFFNTGDAARLRRHRPREGATCWACRRRACSRRCSVYLGSAYINDFNLLGRTYQVTAQADEPFRRDGRRHRQAGNAFEQRAR